MEQQIQVIAYIEWVDSSHLANRWTDREEALGDVTKRLAGEPIRSAGLLLSQDDKAIVLALSFDSNQDDVAQVMLIPRSAILRMEVWPVP